MLHTAATVAVCKREVLRNLVMKSNQCQSMVVSGHPHLLRFGWFRGVNKTIFPRNKVVFTSGIESLVL